MSDTFISPADANLRPSSTIVPSKLYRTCDGSLYGKVIKLSLIVPEGTSTSRNSPGAIGVSSPLILRPRALKPPGKLDSVPASTNCLMREVPDFAKAPTR